MMLPRLGVLCLVYLLMMRITIGNYSLVKHTIFFLNFVHLSLVIEEKPLMMIFHWMFWLVNYSCCYIAFTTKQRVQSSHSISIDSIKFCDLCVFLFFRKLLIQGAEVSTFLWISNNIMITLYILLLVPRNFFCNALVQFEGNVNNFCELLYT